MMTQPPPPYPHHGGAAPHPHHYHSHNTAVPVHMPPPQREPHPSGTAHYGGGNQQMYGNKVSPPSSSHNKQHLSPPHTASSAVVPEMTQHLGPREDEPHNHISVLREHDVLLGRGGGTNNHTGNIAFRKLVQQHKMNYLACSKVEKPKVARHVVQLWRQQDPPGRFLARLDEDAPPDSCIWFEVGDKKANAKASQCLRERTPEVMPYLRQLREQQDLSTEQGLHQFRQHQAAQQQQQQAQQQQHDAPLPLSPNGSHHGSNHSQRGAMQPDMSPSSAHGQRPLQGHPGMYSPHHFSPHHPNPMHHPGMYNNHHGSPTQQREFLSMQAMQQQQQHMASMNGNNNMHGGHPMHPHHPANMSPGMGGGGPVEAFHNSPMGGPPVHLSPMNQGGLPMAPQLDPHNVPSNMEEFPPPGVAVEDMTDLEYEQSMMIMQQQLQMQQMQLKRMQQQRAMQRAALERQQAHFQDMSPIKTPSGVVRGQALPPAPLGGEPEEVSSPRTGLTRHAGLAPGSSPAGKPRKTIPRETETTDEPSSPPQDKEEDDAPAPLAAAAAKPARRSALKQDTDSAPRKPPKRSLSGTQRPSVPDRTHSGFMSISSNDPDHPSNNGAELTLEEYRQQLEDYIANHAQIDVQDNGDGDNDNTVPLPVDDPQINPLVDAAKTNDDNDGVDSDLEDDWEQEKTKSRPRAPRRVPSKKGVDRMKSGTSMMSLDTRHSNTGNLSIFSNLSDLSNGLNPLAETNPAANNNTKKSAPGRSVSNQSHLSIMSELTDLSQNLDELSIREG